MEELYTRRLILRHWRASDLGDLHELLTDPQTAEGAGFIASRSMEESLVRLSGMINSSDAWAVTLKDDDTAAGWIRFRPDDILKNRRGFQVGYAIREDLRRQGYMQEALAAAMGYIFEDASAASVSARVKPDNAASVNVLIKNGFSLAGKLPGYETAGSAGEVLLFIRTRDDPLPKEDESMMAKQLSSLCDPSEGWLTCLCNAVAFIYDEMDMINWAGVYFLKEGKLYLGPFNGKPACSVIDLSRGVCAKSVRDRSTVVVPDVHQFEGHIACDSASASEIVIPLILGGELLGVLDIDSPIRERFGEYEKTMLEGAAKVITGFLKGYREERQ